MDGQLAQQKNRSPLCCSSLWRSRGLRGRGKVGGERMSGPGYREEDCGKNERELGGAAGGEVPHPFLGSLPDSSGSLDAIEYAIPSFYRRLLNIPANPAKVESVVTAPRDRLGLPLVAHCFCSFALTHRNEKQIGNLFQILEDFETLKSENVRGMEW